MCNEKFLYAPEALPHSDPHHSTAYSMYHSTHAHMGKTPAFALLPHLSYSALLVSSSPTRILGVSVN